MVGIELESIKRTEQNLGCRPETYQNRVENEYRVEQEENHCCRNYPVQESGYHKGTADIPMPGTYEIHDPDFVARCVNRQPNRIKGNQKRAHDQHYRFRDIVLSRLIDYVRKTVDSSLIDRKSTRLNSSH